MTLELFATNAAVIAALMLGLWLLSLPIRNASIVDIFWGCGFVVIAWISLLMTDPATSRGWLIVALATVWGLRLSGHLARRNIGEPEDHRYRAMRENQGRWFPLLSLLTVFLLQGVVMLVVSLPLQAAVRADRPLNVLDAFGAAIWLVGLIFESVGDWQLARFKSQPDNRGQVLDHGLWRYTRHPNYFGDFLVWWGLFLVAAAGGGWWTVVSPLVMSVLLMKVSGVALLEKDIHQRRPDYAEYVRRTSPFFPWPPRQESPPA